MKLLILAGSIPFLLHASLATAAPVIDDREQTELLSNEGSTSSLMEKMNAPVEVSEFSAMESEADLNSKQEKPSALIDGDYTPSEWTDIP